MDDDDAGAELRLKNQRVQQDTVDAPPITGMSRPVSDPPTGENGGDGNLPNTAAGR